MTEPDDSASDQAMTVQRLSDEVRALWRIILSLLTMAVVTLTLFCLQTFFSIAKYEKIFSEMLGTRPVPTLTLVTLSLGNSLFTLAALVLLPIGSMTWLWLERARPGLPTFVMLCLCIFLMLFLILVRFSLELPMMDIVYGLPH